MRLADGVLIDQLAHLDADRRIAFVLTQMLGFNYASAAQVCNCPIGTIRSRVARPASNSSASSHKGRYLVVDTLILAPMPVVPPLLPTPGLPRADTESHPWEPNRPGPHALRLDGTVGPPMCVRRIPVMRGRNRRSLRGPAPS